jgi:dTDP-4-dehydrorhamnose reductase
MATTILLTGASGYVGQHLLRSLLCDNGPENLDITALCLSRARELKGVLQRHDTPNELASPEVKVHTLDFSDEDQVSSFLSMRKFDVCIHTGALSSPQACQSQPDVAREVNVPATFLGPLSASGCRIIAFSTDQVYNGSTKTPYEEVDTTDPLNVYAESKVHLEEFLISAASRNGESDNLAPCHVLLRSSIILGPLAPFLPTVAHDTFLHFCASRRDRPTDFYSDERRSVVFVADVVSVIRWLIRSKDVNGVFNLGGPYGVSRYEMAEAVFNHLGFSTDCLTPKHKALEPSVEGCVVTPLDITMNIEKLSNRSGLRFTPLAEIVKATFP